MTVRPETLRIVRYPAGVLRERAVAIGLVDDEVRAVAARMVDLMCEAEGIGLAAPQVGLPWRLFVAHVPEDPEGDAERSASSDPATATLEPMVCINPELSAYTRDLEPFDEGCLSLPGVSGEVRRPSGVTLRAVGLDGEPFEVRGAGLLARCWQHEADHLDGVLILDKFTPRSRLRNRSVVKELEANAIDAPRPGDRRASGAKLR